MPKIIKQFVLPLILGLILCSPGCGQADYESIAVVKVYDGDTIRLANGEKVRLIGIDCPESYESDKLFRDAKKTGQNIEAIKIMGRQSSKFTRDLILGKKVRVEFDVEERDKYGRLLAYIYDVETYKNKIDINHPAGYEIVNGNEIFLNATIVKSGYAKPYTIPPNVKYADKFKLLYKEARSQERGLWQP